MYEKYYIPFVLLIGRADIMPGLNRHYHTDCVIDYQLDRYYDETREGFYLRYLNRNYHKEGFHYQGDDGIDDFNRSFSNKNKCVTLQTKYEYG